MITFIIANVTILRISIQIPNSMIITTAKKPHSDVLNMLTLTAMVIQNPIHWNKSKTNAIDGWIVIVIRSSAERNARKTRRKSWPLGQSARVACHVRPPTPAKNSRACVNKSASLASFKGFRAEARIVNAAWKVCIFT